MHNKYKLATIMAVMSIAPSWAQMDNVIDVEHVYKPEIVDANKVNVLPEVKDLPVKHYKVDYAKNLIPVKSYTFTPMATDGEVQTTLAHKRFVTLGAGTGGNLLGSAALGFDFLGNQSLNLGVGLSGHNAEVAHPDEAMDDWQSRYYRSSASLGYEYRLTPSSSILVNASYESHVFNYQPLFTGITSGDATDKQHNNMASLSAELTPYAFGNWTFGAKVGYEMFSQKYLITDMTDKYGEGVLDAEANIAYTLNSASKLRLSATITSLSPSTDGIEGYTNLAIRPHYYWSNGTIDVRLGLYAGSLGIAPDLGFVYHATPNYHVYADVTGGEAMSNTLARISAINPYSVLIPSQPYAETLELKAQFNQLAARAGLKASPLPGLDIDLNTGYELSADRLEFCHPDMGYDKAYVPAFFADGNRFFVNLNAGYSYRDILSVQLANQFNAWTIDDDNPAGIDEVTWRPVVDLHWAASVQPLSGLRIGVDYSLQTFKEGDATLYSRPTTSSLGASISYTLSQMPMTLYVKGNNLLNADYDHYFGGYRAPGINVLGGVSFSF